MIKYNRFSSRSNEQNANDFPASEKFLLTNPRIICLKKSRLNLKKNVERRQTSSAKRRYFKAVLTRYKIKISFFYNDFRNAKKKTEDATIKINNVIKKKIYINS